ncbi:MAG: hypothetical protein RLZ54_542 [Candidatus Parcubacteria bacterium]|jgi:hypothetical protein
MHSLLQFKKLSAKDKRNFLIELFSNLSETTTLHLLQSNMELSDEILCKIFAIVEKAKKEDMIAEITKELSNHKVNYNENHNAEQLLNNL